MGLSSFLSRLNPERLTALSVLAVISLTLLKLGVGLLTQSLSLLSGALDSILDLVAMFVAFLAVRVARQPADVEYHYGHGKVENFSTFMEALLLIATSSWIFYEALQRLLFKKVGVEVNIWAFIVMGVSITVSFLFSRLLSRAAREYNSQVLEAGALNFATDIWSSMIVVVGLALTRAASVWGVDFLRYGDPAAAMVVAGLVFYASLKISKKAVDVLLDRAPKGMAEQLEKLICSVKGVVDCKRVRVRQAGNKFFVDATILLDPLLSLRRASKVASEVEKKILKVLPGADVVIDTDPSRAPRRIVERIRTLALDEGFSIHGLVVRKVNGKLHVDVHLEVPSDISVGEASMMADRFEEMVKREIPRIEEVNIDLDAAEGGILESTERAVGEELVEKVKEAVESFKESLKGEIADYEVEVKNYDGEPNIYLTLYLDDSMPLRDAHDLSSELEDHIVRFLPTVEEIIIEIEPYKQPKRTLRRLAKQ